MIEITEGLRVEDVKVRRFLRTFTVFFPGDDAKFASANRAKAEVFGRLSVGETTVASRITGVAQPDRTVPRYVVSVETYFSPDLARERQAPGRPV
jgi:hypothetical protein